MNKKGWVRIVEAFIAILLVAGVLLLVYSKQVVRDKDEEIIKIMDGILSEIVNNNHLRQDVMNNNTKNITNFVEGRLPGFLNFTVRICNIDDICGLESYKADTYAREKIVSSTLQEYNATKLKLFVWEK